MTNQDSQPLDKATIQEGLAQGQQHKINEQEIEKLIATIKKQDPTADHSELDSILEAAKASGGELDEAVVHEMIAHFLTDEHHVKEIAGSIADFEIQF